MDLNLIYRALAAGEIDVTAGDATSGLIEALDLTVLEDDRQYFPPYDAVPVARAATLLAHPEVDAALRRLAGRISAAEMRRMNHQVDGLRRDAREVAREFLDACWPVSIDRIGMSLDTFQTRSTLTVGGDTVSHLQPAGAGAHAFRRSTRCRSR